MYSPVLCILGLLRVNLQCGRAATASISAHRFVPPLPLLTLPSRFCLSSLQNQRRNNALGFNELLLPRPLPKLKRQNTDLDVYFTVL